MFQLNLIWICFLIAVVSSCSVGKQLPPPEYLNKLEIIDTNKLRFDGFYSIVDHNMLKNFNVDMSDYTVIRGTVFTKENKIFIGQEFDKSNNPFSCEEYQKINADFIGLFTIKENEIFAFVPTLISLSGGTFYHTYKLNFRGTIKNADTIVGWHAVPPFPKRIKKADIRNIQNSSIFDPHILKFVPTDAVKCLPVQ